MMRSISTPAWEAAYMASMTEGSRRAFILATMRAGRPAAACSDSRRMSCRKLSAMVSGATRRGL
jgi:hypothetical protein